MIEHEILKYLVPPITEEEREGISELYDLLGLEKEEFAKLIEAVGAKTLMRRAKRWIDLGTAYREYHQKICYEEDVATAEKLETELKEVHKRISQYHLDHEL